MSRTVEGVTTTQSVVMEAANHLENSAMYPIRDNPFKSKVLILLWIILTIPLWLSAQEVKIDEWQIFGYDGYPYEVGFHLISSLGNKTTFSEVYIMTRIRGNVDMLGKVIAYSNSGKYILFENAENPRGLFRLSLNNPNTVPQSLPIHNAVVNGLLNALNSDKNSSNLPDIIELL